MKNEGALRRFFRHVGIYRSDVLFLLVNPVQLPPPVGRPRYRAIARDGRSTPFPSSAMSSGRLFLDRVARQQCPSPLRRQCEDKTLDRRSESNYHRTASFWFSGCLTPWVHSSNAKKKNKNEHRICFSQLFARQPTVSPGLICCVVSTICPVENYSLTIGDKRTLI